MKRKKSGKLLSKKRAGRIGRSLTTAHGKVKDTACLLEGSRQKTNLRRQVIN
jgi:hypothetical protein